MTVDIAAGAAEDNAGNLSVAADQFSIVADLTQVPMNRSPVLAATVPNWTLVPDATPERGRVRGVRRPRRRCALLHGVVVGSTGGDGKCPAHLRDARGGEGGCGHDPGDGDGPRREAPALLRQRIFEHGRLVMQCNPGGLASVACADDAGARRPRALERAAEMRRTCVHEARVLGCQPACPAILVRRNREQSS